MLGRHPFFYYPAYFSGFHDFHFTHHYCHTRFFIGFATLKFLTSRWYQFCAYRQSNNHACIGVWCSIKASTFIYFK